jgi:pyridoxal phosphate enzyme (YggS family)
VQSIESNLVALNARIAEACRLANRDPASVTLIGVSKTKPLAAVREAAASGVRHMGENYLDEAIAKIDGSRDLDLTWHFIGRIQSNKSRLIAQYFDWVHTVDRLKIARRLNDQCPPGKRLNTLIQVNIDDDPAKGGIAAALAPELLAQMSALPNLQVRGLMAILAQNSDPGASYQSMAQLFTALRRNLEGDQKLTWDTLSLGMTADLEQAIDAGSTHVRIGTALFGARDRQAMGAQQT